MFWIKITLTFTFFWILKTSNLTQKSYKILPVSELKQLLALRDKNLHQFDVQLKTNRAFVYYLQPEGVIVLPGSLSEKSNGILFEKKVDFDLYLNQDLFPIENEKKTLEEKYQGLILSIPQNIDNITDYFNHKFNTGEKGRIKNPNISSLLTLIKDKYKSEKCSEIEKIYQGILLGEYVRTMMSAKWIGIKNYGTFNPYYTPGLIYPDSTVIVLRDKIDLFFDNKTLTPEAYINLPFIKNSPLKIESDYFKTNYSGYKIIE